MNRPTLVTASFALLLFGCDPTYHARVDDGAGLSEGSPVLVSSVRVGQVESVRVVEDHVDVELSIGRDHEITMRADACALARRTEQGPELIIMPGRGAPLEDGRVIPQCEITQGDVGDLLRTLGQGVGDMLRQLGQGMSGGAGQAPFPFGGASPSPSAPGAAPLPPPPSLPPSGP